ncbi:phosphopentomutase [Thalassoglobus neptunius]|uniref:Phosphopentomutase n=1 Tax=Thalassoglobus neptunius TaxID=1938619 RepID=A0A5C5X231_9PLAN|nr:alkaline phosphatase family protein [Thalassoglobus neptunius]TWT56888.1 phosphopentomutase [Thalassoglobus neptunius]
MTKPLLRSLTIVLLAVTFVFSPSLSAEEQVPTRRALLIGIDGLRADALKAAKTPHIDALIEKGAFTENTQILGERYQDNDTISGPGWSSFLTGVWADKHGVNDNSFTGKNYTEYPHFFHYVKAQFPQAQTYSFVDWTPIDEHIVSDADVHKVYPAHGHEEYTKQDREVTRDTVTTLREADCHVVMAYLGAVDETGHRYGFHPSVSAYITAIERVDAQVGQMIRAVRSRPDFDAENWLIVISTDHGGQGLGHGGGHSIDEIRTTFLVVSGSSSQPGEIEEQTYLVDVPVTVLTHLGVEIDPDWKLDGQPRGLKE